jgi:rfaE bifunctional protein kinase chain/domain
MNQQNILSAIDKFSDLKILVIGDVILDAYFSGSVNRISPEAPVSILDIEKKEYRLGGAANVALNVQGLGAKPILCSVLGSDFAGKQVLDLMSKHELSIEGLGSSAERITSVKTRLVSNHHQLLRMDEEQCEVISKEDQSGLKNRITDLIVNENPDAIIFEDYDKGVISAVLIQEVIELARQHSIPVTVDPKRRNFLSYAGATLFKPNLKELRDGLNQQDLSADPESLQEAYGFLNDIMPTEMVLFTLSSKGMFIASENESHHFPAQPRDIADVSGAGDTVISTATCALAAGLGLEEITYLANFAGGWVCQYPGVVSIDALTLKNEIAKITA